MKANNLSVIQIWIKNVTDKSKQATIVDTKNIFFRGNVIYSYSEKWPIGIFIGTTTDEHNQPVHKFILNNSKISASTSKHQKILSTQLFFDNAKAEIQYKNINELLKLI